LGRYLSAVNCLPIIALAALWLIMPTGAQAAAINTTDQSSSVKGRYGSIVVDADSLEIIHARQIDAQRYPASLTKLMTLYLTFDALDSGQLKLTQNLPVSRKAQNTPPGKLGVKKGQTITVDQAIQALAVKSANDVAVVLAEAMAGSEAQFAEMMTAKAKSLGMIKTQFANAHGLPNTLQVTTARDMAKLAMAILNNHRRYYHYFGQTHFNYKGTQYKNTNNLLHWLNGVDGFKTGYTRASGYNLVISAKRDNRRIIAVVLGGASSGARNTHMKELIERSFKTMGVAEVASLAPVTVKPRKTLRKPVAKTAKPTLTKSIPSSAVRLRGRDSQPVTVITQGAPIPVQSAALDQAWAVQVGAFGSPQAANAQLSSLAALVGRRAAPGISEITRNERTLFRARFTGMSFETANETCRRLGRLKTGCAVVSPGGR
jgi:D-alanyl-D-alanine carboxypeptidase